MELDWKKYRDVGGGGGGRAKDELKWESVDEWKGLLRWSNVSWCEWKELDRNSLERTI